MVLISCAAEVPADFQVAEAAKLFLPRITKAVASLLHLIQCNMLVHHPLYQRLIVDMAGNASRCAQ
jgi:hypothetical protein